MTMDTPISYPEPPAVIKERPSLKKYLRYLLFFGPGAIVASVTIGQGQLILGPQIGAWAGFSLLWLITISAGSFIIAYMSCRFTMLTGIGLMDLFAVKTKYGWLNWLFIIIMIPFIPIFTGTIITSLGQSLAWIFGVGHYLIWGISFCFLAGILVILGRYKILEFTQAFFVVILVVGAIVSVISLKPDILQILPHYFIITAPATFPDWVSQNYPSVTTTPIPLYMLGYLGTLTFTIITLIGYLGWIKVKKWGIFKHQDDPLMFSQHCFESFQQHGKIIYLSENAEEKKKAKQLLVPLKVDLTLAFVVVAIVSSAYMIAGTLLLAPGQLLPRDAKLIQDQVIIFNHLADWLRPIFQISVFFALFGTVYAGFEAASRMLYETGKNLIKPLRKMPYKKFIVIVFLYLLIAGGLLSVAMSMGVSVLLMLSITLMFLGVIGVIIYGTGALILTQRALPKTYRLGPIRVVIVIAGIVCLAIPLVFFFI
jgi:Mn2+/Fe2+ NRAMP family transporter